MGYSNDRVQTIPYPRFPSATSSLSRATQRATLSLRFSKSLIPSSTQCMRQRQCGPSQQLRASPGPQIQAFLSPSFLSLSTTYLERFILPRRRMRLRLIEEAIARGELNQTLIPIY
jgi:hypothetical protein